MGALVTLSDSTQGQSIRSQRAEIRRLERLGEAGTLSREQRKRLTLLRKRDYVRGYHKATRKTVRRKRKPTLSPKAQMAEMLALQALAAERSLSHDESERLGELILLEQQRSRYRPEQIARLRARIARASAELELLETLEIAERGAVAEGCANGAPVDLAPSIDGTWTTTERQAA